MEAGRTSSLLLALPLWMLALSLCAWIYWPGLAGPALLDDTANLRSLELLGDQPDLITDVVAGNYSGPLGRPLSMLSFSLEKVYLGGGVAENKRFNLCLHLLIGCLLLVLCRDIYASLAHPRPLFLALATASLWLFAPLLLSTVLYIVQRMAQLATVFTLLALWAYLRCRIGSGLPRVFWGALCLLALVAAPLSKENGLLALPLLMWLEWTVLRFAGLGQRAQQRWRRVFAALPVVSLLLLAALLVLRPESLVGGFSTRDFSLTERLLTQSRVLWTYVGQLLWANSNGLGLYQDDVTISHGLLDPVATLFAVLAWCAVTAATFLLARRRDTAGIAFGIGFFLVAHAMESSIFPLELYFEHRNYLPAAGLFIALVSAAAWLAARWSWCANWLWLGGLAFAGHAVLVTAAEAQLWSHSYLVHVTAVNRFPDSLRANVEMSRVMARRGDLQQALRYADHAERLESRTGLRQQLRRVTLYCLARPAVSPEVIGELSATTSDFRDDQVSEMMYILVKNIVDGACPETDLAALGDRLGELTLVSDPRYVSPKMSVSLAILENHSGRYAQALAHVNALLGRSPDSIRALMMKMYFTAALEMNEENASVLEKLRELDREGLLNRQQQYNLALFTGTATSVPP